MYKEKIQALLTDVQQGEVDIAEAMRRLENLPFEELGFAHLDHHRALRKGLPEVVFCENKTASQVVGIVRSLSQYSTVLATRASAELYDTVKQEFDHAEYNDTARTIIVPGEDAPAERKTKNKILVVSAGTSDIPVAEEAVVTAEVMGNPVEKLYDVGVAGIHRLFGNRDKIDAANVLVVVAGMDGVLPSVVSGWVEKPVIAVPTSVGYGASFQGVGPLLTMLNACAPGIVVVNIDNGFGAGYFASLVNK